MRRSRTCSGEDAEHTLIFVDMLGFAELTERCPYRVVHQGPDEHGFSSSRTGPIQNQINVFHNVVDQCVFDHSLNGDIHAMLFSDCAFIDAGNSVRAALIAVELMRKCVKRHVPVRMGIGKGTFYLLTFSTESSGSTLVSRSRFVGTAAVRAHEAEQCGGKGMRIFLHPSFAPENRAIGNIIKVLPLSRRFEKATCELDYLHEQRAAQQTPSAQEADVELFESVASMNDPHAPFKVRRQYSESFKALNRMRKANSRPEVNVRRLVRRLQNKQLRAALGTKG